MEKVFIKNRYNKNICVLVEESPEPQGLVFVMHGLGGFKEQPHIEDLAKVFRDNNYVVVRFDTTNTFGESDGNYSDATVTNYYEDLEDVINWAKTQDFFQAPFILAGHSLGAICSALYAENYPSAVKALAPISAAVSGQLSLIDQDQEEMKEWEKTGWRTTIGYSSGIVKKLKWSHMVDRLKYDLLPKADQLTMPTILLVGELDDSTPLKHQQLLFDKLPGKKELQVIKGAPHTFREKEHLAEIYQIMDRWIKNLDK